MPKILGLFIIASVVGLLTATTSKPQSKRHKSQLSCQEFSQGVKLNDTQAIGMWYLLQYKTRTTSDDRCVEFMPVTDEERKDLSEKIGKFVENLKWENMTLKMQIPCSGVKPSHSRDYYLEKLEEEGSYRTLQMPSTKAKSDVADYHRYPMRLKIVEGTYLGMMDCHEHFVFLLGKQPQEGKEIDEKLNKMIETYWPEEHQ